MSELEKENQSDLFKTAIRLRCAHDLELYSIAFFPHYCIHEFNEFHLDDFKSIKFMERCIKRVRGAPRGYAKSTFKALIKPCHDVCYGLEDFIVFISNTQQQANGKLKDIRTEIVTNSDLIDVYGISFPRKNPGETAYEIGCGDHTCKMEAYGANTEIRGIRYGAKRPTKIIVDDSEHSEEVNNEDIRGKYSDWYFQVVSNIGNEQTNIEFIGTVLHRDSLLANLLKNPAYDGKLYKAVINWSEREDLWLQWREIYTNLDNDNRLAESEAFYQQNERDLMKGVKVLWPEKEPYLALMKEMVEKGRRNFMKEKQNEPISSKDALFEVMHWYKETPTGILVEKTNTHYEWKNMKHTAMAVIDPSTGQTKAKVGRSGDFACILTGYQDPRGRLLVHHDWTKRKSPTKQIKEIFELNELYKYHKFGVETNLYRELLLPNIATEKQKREKERQANGDTNYEIKLSFYDIVQTENKDKRIHTLEPKVSNGYILFNRALSQEFLGMMEIYPTAGQHDDGPDALEMLWSLANNRYQFKAVNMDVMYGR